MVQGAWDALPTITREERNLLWGCAALFDESDKAQPPWLTRSIGIKTG
jgi:hypothetical protein